MARISSLNDLSSVMTYLTRIGAEVRSLRTAVIRQTKGRYWVDIVLIQISQDGKVTCSATEFEPTQMEKLAIEAECLNSTWPTVKLLPRLINLPPELSQTDPKKLFIFRDEHNNVLMLQHRIDKDGDKRYIPWTYWDDDVWRPIEPEGQLPLWGQEQLKNFTTVFIHEGAKAARRIAEMCACATPEDRERFANHPWAEELSHAAHLGWIGGALSPARTNWKIINESDIKTVFIVSDNDKPGVEAVSKISFFLQVPTFHIQFPDEFPMSFDLGDDFPRPMFKELDGIKYYNGPSFKDCLHPATWATDLVPNPQGKPSYRLRNHFKDMWCYVEKVDTFVCVTMPEIILNERVMNNKLMCFSHTTQTSQLILKAYTGYNVSLCYKPGTKERHTISNNSSAINLHIPTRIKPKVGSIKPFLDFMNYMFPIERERKEVLRWCATLIARPDMRIPYAMLLVSETQGIGKTTLGAHILAPLVGSHNVSFPTEEQVQGEFNSWIANKRLCIFNEIYAGHSWKVANRLKNLITDEFVDVNEKYQRKYTAENWIHIFACSNSLTALKIENTDRRWFYPEVTEERWPQENFEHLYSWIKSGGLSIIYQWAIDFDGEYIHRKEIAPMTDRKQELIVSSMSEEQGEAMALAERMIDYDAENKPVAVTMKRIEEIVRGKINGHSYHDSDLTLRSMMKERGVLVWKKQIMIEGRTQKILMNHQALKEIRNQLGEVRLTVKKSEIDFVETPEERSEIKLLANKTLAELVRSSKVLDLESL